METMIRFGSNKILKSSKAISFNNFKTNITLEPHLILNFNPKHKPRFRLSNHTLMIEKGRHLKIDKHERKCIFCESEIKNEEHFLIICPIYCVGRKSLENICNEICTRYEHLNEKQKFIFLMSNENDKIIKAIGKFISNSFIIREKIINSFIIREKIINSFIIKENSNSFIIREKIINSIIPLLLRRISIPLLLGRRLSIPLLLGRRLSIPLLLGRRLSIPLLLGRRLSIPLLLGRRLSMFCTFVCRCFFFCYVILITEQNKYNHVRWSKLSCAGVVSM